MTESTSLRERLQTLAQTWRDDWNSLCIGAPTDDDDFERGYRCGQRDRAQYDAEQLAAVLAAQPEFCESRSPDGDGPWSASVEASSRQRCQGGIASDREQGLATEYGARLSRDKGDERGSDIERDGNPTSCGLAGSEPADSLSVKPLAALPEAPAATWLDTREFYDVMQTYRTALREKPADVVDAFEAVKAFIRAALDPPPAPPETPR